MNKEKLDCPHCGQDLRLSPDAKREIEAARDQGYADALRGEEIEALVAAVESAHKRLREKAQSAKRVWSTQQWLKKDQEQYDLEEKALKAFRAACGEKE